MTAASAAGAASHDTVDWHAIDWPKAHAIVRRLQARIVKATQAGRWGKVNALQRLLTHSWSGKVLAVKRVTENPGKHSAGNTRKEDRSGIHPASTWLPRTTRATSVHSQSERQETPPGHRNAQRPGNAGPLPAGPGSHRRNPRGPQLLRVPTRAIPG